MSLLHSSTAVSVRLLHPPPFPCHSWRRSQLLSASSLCHLAMKQSAASTTPRYNVPPFLAAVGHNSLYSEQQGKAFRGSLSGSKHPEVVHLDIAPSAFLIGLVPNSSHQPLSQTSPDGLAAHCSFAVRPPQIGDVVCGLSSRRSRMVPSRGPWRTT